MNENNEHAPQRRKIARRMSLADGFVSVAGNPHPDTSADAAENATAAADATVNADAGADASVDAGADAGASSRVVRTPQEYEAIIDELRFGLTAATSQLEEWQRLAVENRKALEDVVLRYSKSQTTLERAVDDLVAGAHPVVRRTNVVVNVNIKSMMWGLAVTAAGLYMVWSNLTAPREIIRLPKPPGGWVIT